MAFDSSMIEALRLTRSGNLTEATALLQGSFRSGMPVAPMPPAASGSIQSLLPPATTPRGAPDQSELGQRFEERTYRGNEGAMAYRLYRPARATNGMPLLVMLHGCTQSPEDFARGTGMNRLADELGFLVAYPKQTPTANPQRCWNWFRPGDQQRDRGEPALLAGITREVIAEHRIDADRVYVAGLSAGGAAAAIMAAQYPDIFAAVGVHSGLGCGAARDLPSALAAMRSGGGTRPSTQRKPAFVPVITFHGDRDTTVHEVNSTEIVANASAASGVSLSVRTEKGRSESGRPYSRALSVGPDGAVLIEQWTIEGSGHAWSGGDASGSYTDPSGPEASREMMRFFLDRKRT